MLERQILDIIIIGGSYAGLSAALSLGRLSKTVLIIDAGHPCNVSAPKSYNFLTQNGTSPAEILEVAKAQVLSYPTVQFVADEATTLTGEDGNFEVDTRTGQSFSAKKILFATGVTDILPKTFGYRECWGISIVHCPYCHGHEFSGKAAAIIAEGEAARQLANLLLPLHSNLTIICSEQNEDFDFGDYVKVINNQIEFINHQAGQLKSINFEDGTVLNAEVLYINPNFEQRCKLPKSIGCEFTEKGLIHIGADHQTTVNGIYACGDCTSLMRSIATAVASGNLAGAIINKELSQSYVNKVLNDTVF